MASKTTIIEICITYQPIWWAVPSGSEKTRQKQLMVEAIQIMKNTGKFIDRQKRWWRPFKTPYPYPHLIELLQQAGYEFDLVDCPEMAIGKPWGDVELERRWREQRNKNNNGQPQARTKSKYGWIFKHCDKQGYAYLQVVREIEREQEARTVKGEAGSN